MPALAIRFALHCWLGACLQINFLKEQGWAQEGYQCSLCWANGEVLIVTTVDAFNAHTAEVHGGESVPEVAESEVQFEEGGGGLDKEIELVEEVAELPLDSTYLVEEVVGGESVPEVAEVEVQLEEGGGHLDKEIELMEEVAEPPLDPKYLVEDVEGGGTGMMVSNLNDEENPDIGTTEIFVDAGPHYDGNHNSVDEGGIGHICTAPTLVPIWGLWSPWGPKCVFRCASISRLYPCLVPIWSPFIFKVPIFSILDLRTCQKSVQPLSNVNVNV